MEGGSESSALYKKGVEQAAGVVDAEQIGGGIVTTEGGLWQGIREDSGRSSWAVL